MSKAAHEFQTIGEVCDRVRLSRSQVYRLAQSGKFPLPVKLGAHKSGWHKPEVDKYLQDQMAARKRSA